MPRRTNLISRGEIKDKIDKSGKDMNEKEDTLEKDTLDIETIRKTLSEIKGGTSEGFEAVETSIKDAENVTTEVFDRESNDLDQIQKHSELFGQEIKEKEKASEGDLSKISEALNEFKTKEPDSKFNEAKDQATHDIEILKEQEERERNEREKSESIQRELTARIKSGRKR